MTLIYGEAKTFLPRDSLKIETVSSSFGMTLSTAKTYAHLNDRGTSSAVDEVRLLLVTRLTSGLDLPVLKTSFLNYYQKIRSKNPFSPLKQAQLQE